VAINPHSTVQPMLVMLVNTFRLIIANTPDLASMYGSVEAFVAAWTTSFALEAQDQTNDGALPLVLWFHECYLPTPGGTVTVDLDCRKIARVLHPRDGCVGVCHCCCSRRMLVC
jgi:hypothetical protein